MTLTASIFLMDVQDVCTRTLAGEGHSPNFVAAVQPGTHAPRLWSGGRCQRFYGPLQASVASLRSSTAEYARPEYLKTGTAYLVHGGVA